MDEALPELRTLDVESAAEAAALVRRRLRPEVVDRLRRLYVEQERPEHDDPTTFVDIAQLELRLQELEVYSERLDIDLGLADRLVAAHERPVELVDVRTDGRTVAECYGRLYSCPLSRFFVHGPITMRYVATLAQRLLGPGERLVEVADATWRQIVVNHSRLTVYDAGTRVDVIVGGRGDESFAGSLRTSDGRTLKFGAVQVPDRPVYDEAGFNAITFALLRAGLAYDRDAGVWRVGLADALPGELAAALSEDVPLVAMTLVDLLAVGMVNIRRGNGRQVLLAGVRNLPLPENAGDVLGGGALELSVTDDGARPTTPGTYLVPIEYRFASFQERPASALLAETDVPYVRLLPR